MADALQNIFEVIERIDITELATADQTVDRRGPIGPSFTAGKQPVLAAQRHL